MNKPVLDRLFSFAHTLRCAAARQRSDRRAQGAAGGRTAASGL